MGLRIFWGVLSIYYYYEPGTRVSRILRGIVIDQITY